jgi:hypothetical protein
LEEPAASIFKVEVIQVENWIFILGFCILLRVLYQGYQKNHPSQQLFRVFILYIFLPLHVTALVGHLQVEYTFILGSYFTHNGSVVLCY